MKVLVMAGYNKKTPIYVEAVPVLIADQNKNGKILKSKDDDLFFVQRKNNEGEDIPAYKFSTLSEALKFLK